MHSEGIDRDRLTKDELRQFDQLCHMKVGDMPRDAVRRSWRRTMPALVVVMLVAAGLFVWLVNAGMSDVPGADVPPLVALGALVVVVLPVLGVLSAREARRVLALLPGEFLESIGYAVRPKPPTIRGTRFVDGYGWEDYTYVLTATRYPDRYFAYARDPACEPKAIKPARSVPTREALPPA